MQKTSGKEKNKYNYEKYKHNKNKKIRLVLLQSLLIYSGGFRFYAWEKYNLL